MRQSLIGLICFMVVFPQIATATGEDEFSRLKSFKTSLMRPPIVPEVPLTKRSGFTDRELQILKTKFSVVEIHRLEAVAREFWGASLLTSMAAFSDATPDDQEVPSDDEWFSRFPVQDFDSVFQDPDRASRLPVWLAYLSESGFMKIESSEELTPKSSVELFGGVPIADICEREPGSEIPVDFSMRFSPWEFGARLASSSRLEASLLDLALSPDAFDFKNAAEDDFNSTDDDLDDEDGHEHNYSGDTIGWTGFLARLDTKLKTGPFKISDLVSQTRRDQTIDQSIRRLILAIAVSAQGLKKNCESSGNIWNEVRWGDDHWLEFFSCRDKDGKQDGALFRLENGDFADGRAIFSLNTGSFRIEAILDGDSGDFSVRYADAVKKINSEIWFFREGGVRALFDDSTQPARRIVFGPDGQIRMMDSLAGTAPFRRVTWYSNGNPRSFEIRATDGSVSVIGGYHISGQPRYWMPLRGGKTDGKYLWWHLSGRLAGELDFVSNKRFGRGALYYGNGVEGFHAEYAEDLPHGAVVWRDPSRRPLFSLGFKSGRPHGLLEIRHGGRTIAEAKFSGGAVEGTIVLRNTKGLGVAELPYKAGLLNGIVNLRDSAGAVRVKSSWIDGQVHGDTVAYYANLAKAASCKFDDGHLTEWSSFHPDGHRRYTGKMLPGSAGHASIDYYGGSDDPVLRCTSLDSEIDSCVALKQGKSFAAPSLKELLGKTALAGDLKFKAEKCGGVNRSFDVSPFADATRGKINISYRTKELCPSPNLARGLDCVVELNEGKWSNVSCVLSDDDQSTEDDE